MDRGGLSARFGRRGAGSIGVCSAGGFIPIQPTPPPHRAAPHVYTHTPPRRFWTARRRSWSRWRRWRPSSSSRSAGGRPRSWGARWVGACVRAGGDAHYYYDRSFNSFYLRWIGKYLPTHVPVHDGVDGSFIYIEKSCQPAPQNDHDPTPPGTQESMHSLTHPDL